MIPNMGGVMLATAGKNPNTLVKQLNAETDRWVFDVKQDGVRCMAFVDKGTARLVNRQGTDISFQYPEIVAHLVATYPTTTLVLDGEMLCFDPATGQPTFNRMQKRNSQSNPRTIAQLAVQMPATLVAFDLLYHNTADLRRVMLQGRLLLLEKAVTNHDRLMLSVWSDDGEAMWQVVADNGLEGLIAKNKSSLYRAGRSSAWVKLKPTHRITALAYDWEFGKKDGARADTLGALFLGLYDGTKIVDAGKVGTGFKLAELQPLIERIEAWKGDPEHHMPLLVEVEFQDLLDSGKLRFPVFLNERTDKGWDECTVDQLTEG